MKKLNSDELRNLYLDYFIKHDHKLISNASLIPENDPTVLFTTAGMHPLVPYLKGETHPSGKRLVGIQKCIRTNDIDEVGDSSHLTFFEMLGNWSLGDYFKEESIKMSYEFLTSKDYLDIPKDRLYFTLFEGGKEIPKDIESYNVYKSLKVEDSHIFFLEDNFWILGSGIGPCGPDTEMFYDTGKEKCSENCNPSCSCGKYLELWNNVFMQYYKNEDGTIKELSQVNVDTGMGFERILGVINDIDSVYDTELFYNIKNKLEELSNKKYEDNLVSFRIIMDHLRASVFILGDNKAIIPSNTGQGYVLRRLIRRTIRYLKKLNITDNELVELADIIINDYKKEYKELDRHKNFIFSELEKEEKKFNNTLTSGERMFNKLIHNLAGNTISGVDAFKLFDTFGFPLEMTIELAKENNLNVDTDGFYKRFEEHQNISRTIEAGSFKGGLADQSYETTKYHTLAHLLLAALQKIYGKEVIQKGSNITSERLRFDFNVDHKLSNEEIKNIEDLVNEYIKSNTLVNLEEMTYEDAKKSGAHGTFDNKYGNIVKVYTIGNISKEICNGPHVENTKELGTFKIIKEESSSAGIRRIKGVLIK